MDRAERIADKLAADWDSRAAYQTLSGDFAPADLAEAYRAQALLQERLAARRGPVAGRKIALTSRAIQEMVKLYQPIGAAFFRNDIRWSPAKVRLAEFRRLGVEFELAFELARDVPPQGVPHDRESVRPLIAGIRPAFELIEDRAADDSAIDGLTMVCDNAWCGGVVLGAPLPGWDRLDLDALPATIEQTGQPPEHVVTGAASPLKSFVWMLNHASAAGRTIGRGEHIITGSASRTRFPKAGDLVRYSVDGLASVEAEIV